MTPFRLIHRDDRIAAFDKPSGLLVHRGWADDDDTALDRARDALGVRVYPVHRLDRATSGVLLFALDAVCAAALSRVFEDGRAEKTYLALVRGVAPPSGRVDHPIPRREGGPRVTAATRFERRWASSDPERRCSLVAAMPETGRLHQVRRHMKHISHPLIGDANYGKGAINRDYRERFGLDRLALHAARLAFDHPFGGARVAIEAPLPDDLATPFARIGVPEIG